MSASPAERFAALTSGQRLRLLRRLVELGRAHEIPAVVPARDPGPALMSPAQQDLWTHDRLYPGSPALNLASAYHFDTPVAAADLRAALVLVLAQHDGLRSRFTADEDDQRVQYRPVETFELETVDLRDRPGDLREVATAYAQRPFDLSDDWLIRGQVITVDDTRTTLVLALHHIVNDWWSFDVLHGEFVAALAALRSGAAPQLSRPALQYADFASWQRQLADAGVYDARLNFWREHLADVPPPLDLTPGGTTGAGPGMHRVPFHIPADGEAAVREFARRNGATVYVVLMTAFAVLTHRLTGRSDFVLGTPTANRSAAGLERMIGYVMNAAPTRWRVTPQDTFTDLVARFATAFPRILANADIPVGRIVSAVDPQRLPGRSPLFQWVFMYLPNQRSAEALQEVADPDRIPTGGEHDLVGSVQDSDDGFIGGLEIRADVFTPELVAHWAQSFTQLVANLIAEPGQPIGAVDMLTGTQRRRLLGDPAPAPVPLPVTSLADLVAQRARQTPDAIALEAPQLWLSYAALIDRAARLATRLIELGVRPGDLVAIGYGRSAATVIALLAAQWCGAAYLPLDPQQPPDRLRHLLTSANPTLLLADRPVTGVRHVRLDPLAALSEPPAEPVPVDARAAGYVLYTSGSTGQPKGVVVSHAGIATLAGGLTGALALDARSRVLFLGSPAFDITVGEMCMAFGSGGTLVVPPAGPLAGDELAAVLRRDRISAVLIPPGLLASVPADEFPDLRAVCVGADVCPPALATTWATGGRRFVNAYGPTEFTCAVTLSDPIAAGARTVPIGRPLPGIRAYVLDARLAPVPPGVAGELYLAGPGLARGYLAQPAGTAQRFVPDPFGPAGTRMYRTGDLVRRDPQDRLHFAGRSDEQVQLRGLRIEPAEVEAVLTRHEAVDRAVVTVRQDEPGRPRLIAYVVPHPGADPDGTDLLAYAARALPPYLLPSMVVTLDAIPVTANGKVDRAALPAPAPASTTGRTPQTRRERELCAIIAGILGVSEVGADDDFFAHGGDSLAVIALVGRSRTAGLALTVADVFAARTPAALAVLARDASGGETDTGVGRFPLTPIMRWWRGLPGPVEAFRLPALLGVPAGLTTGRLTDALRALADRHGALRMRLLPDNPGGEELEIPEPGTADIALSVVDARAMTADDLRTAAVRAAADAGLSPGQGRMAAAVWYDRGPDDPGRLLLTVHHLAVDVVSWHILRRDLTALLTGATRPPAPGTSLRGWSGHLHRYAAQIDDQLPMWVETLAAPHTRLSPDKVQDAERAVLTVTLPAGTFTGRTEDALLTALVAAAVRWRDRGPTLLVELEGHGRVPIAGDLSGTVGWFTTVYPVLLEAGDDFWDSDTGPRLAVRAIRARLNAVPDDGLGFGVLRHLRPDTAAELAALPAPDLNFNYLGHRDATAAPEQDLDLLSVATAGGPALTHLIAAEVLMDGDEPVATLSYPPGVLAEEEVRRLAGWWAAALEVLHGRV